MKFYGKIGFWFNDVETAPGVHRPQIIERSYAGDVLRSYRKWQSTDTLTDELRLNNQITIVSDMYMQQNWASIKYVKWNGVYWKVNTVEVNYPRLTLEIGGEYRGQVAPETP